MLVDGLWWHLVLLPLVLLLDHLFRDPEQILGVPHPVIAMGRLIDFAERLARKPEPLPFLGQRVCGFLALGALVAVIVGPVVVLHALMMQAEFGLQVVYGVFSASMAAWLVAARGLYDRAVKVKKSVEQNALDAARENIRALVGRNTEQLNSSALLRSTGESLAENLSDAVIAPLLFFVLFGLPGIVAYKLINTLDSMWGYRNATYRDFGYGAARLDDLLNIVPARFSALVLLCAGVVKNRAGLWNAARTVWRDASRHPSPNAGYPEAAMAGLSGQRFGGPREYPGGIIEDVWLGDGREEWQAEDLDYCLVLYRRTLLLLVVLSVGLAMLIGTWE